MEWVSIFAGLPFDASPVCTDSVVAAYARALNDVLPDDQRQRLIPFIPRLATTANGCPPYKRALLCADVAVCVFAPAALRAAGLEEWAGKLAGLPEITDGGAARPAALAATSAAGAASRVAARAFEATSAGGSPARVIGASELAADAATRAAAGAARVAAPARADEIWDAAIALLDRLIELH